MRFVYYKSGDCFAAVTHKQRTSNSLKLSDFDTISLDLEKKSTSALGEAVSICEPFRLQPAARSEKVRDGKQFLRCVFDSTPARCVLQ